MSSITQRQRADPEPAAPDESRLYTIGELAAELLVTTRTIRFYEPKGLIAPARGGVAGAYCRRDRARLMLILRGKKGLSMAMVQRLRARFRVPADLLLPPPGKAPRRAKRAAA